MREIFLNYDPQHGQEFLRQLPWAGDADDTEGAANHPISEYEPGDAAQHAPGDERRPAEFHGDAAACADHDAAAGHDPPPPHHHRYNDHEYHDNVTATHDDFNHDHHNHFDDDDFHYNHPSAVLKNEAVIVGNGSSLLDTEKGAEIDAHAVVCRFNHCPLKGLEKHTGTKTDIWFTVLRWDDVWVRDLHPLREIVVHSWEKDGAACHVLATYRGVANVSKLDHALVDEVRAFMGGEYKDWSTGALAIWMMLRRFPKVTVTGFDWWEERPSHHYGDNWPRGPLHDPPMERRLIDRLVEQGKATFL